MSKNCPKLSKNYPFLKNRSRKIRKKSKKSRKNLNFSLFFLWSQPPFCQQLYYHLSWEFEKKMSQKKVEKKTIFIFANFFFKIHFGHFFMSNFKIKKKVLKTPTFSIFSTLGKLSFIPRKSIFRVFFMEIAFSGELLITLHFFPIFLPLKIYHLSPENRYFVFFLWNLEFRGNF